MPTLPEPKFLKTLHVSPRLGAVYVNNPKVACSTIKLALQRAEAGDPAWQPRTSVHDHAASPLLTWPEVTMDNWQAALSGRFVFSFVRNPYARLRSAYLNKIVEPQKKGVHRVRAGFDRDYLPGFGEFVIAICRLDPLRHDAHWRPQSLNLSHGAIQLDFVGRLEAFAQDWAAVAGRLGLGVTPERAGKATAKTDQSALEFTDQMRRDVARTYAGDFDAYGYDPDLIP